MIEAYFTRPMPAAGKRALDAELARYGRFLGLPARLEVCAAGPPRTAGKR